MSTIRGAVAVALLIIVVPSWAQRAGEQSGTLNSAATSQHRPAASAPSVNLSTEVLQRLERIARTQETQAAASKPEGDQQRERDDLQAQQDMAYWAQLMFYATLASVAFAFVSVVLLIQTLKEASRSSRAAIRASDAARLANRIAGQSAEKQLRAYLNVFEVDVDWKDDDDLGQPRTSIGIRIKNTGQTLAHNVRAWRAAHIQQRVQLDGGLGGAKRRLRID